MYEPFPGNYVWNLSVNLALAMGGAIGEIDRANDEVRLVAQQGEDAGTEAFFEAWGKMADRLVSLGEEAEAQGHGASAAEKYCRATAYYMTAECMQSRHYAPREGGVEHVSADNMEPVRSYIADWIADRFARMVDAS